MTINHYRIWSHLVICTSSKHLSARGSVWWQHGWYRIKINHCAVWTWILLKQFGMMDLTEFLILYMSKAGKEERKKKITHPSHFKLLQIYWPICHCLHQPINHQSTHPFLIRSLMSFTHSISPTLCSPISFFIYLPYLSNHSSVYQWTLSRYLVFPCCCEPSVG